MPKQSSTSVLWYIFHLIFLGRFHEKAPVLKFFFNKRLGPIAAIFIWRKWNCLEQYFYRNKSDRLLLCSGWLWCSILNSFLLVQCYRSTYQEVFCKGCYGNFIYFAGKDMWQNPFLTHFMPLIFFDNPCKYQKPKSFLMFSGGFKRKQCHEMG